MYRNEYPRPQFVRNEWINLNGTWEFEFDDRNKGLTEKWFKDDKRFTKKIQVPFSYQSELSGIQDVTFHDWVWYRRGFELPKEYVDNKRVILHFGAVDYRAMVYVNEQFVGFHEGGHTPFSFDITAYLKGGTETLTVRAEDPSTDETIPRGKQFWEERSEGIWYTRTSGIWQTVWLEAVDETHLEKLRFTPDLDNGDIIIEFELSGQSQGKAVEIEISYDKQLVSRDIVITSGAYTKRSVNLFGREIFRTEYHNEGWTWTPETPNLFDVVVRVSGKGKVLDEVTSYFGMRKIHTEKGMIFLNNKPYYQKLVLDQGYWPAGLLTAPTDEDLRRDIELAKEMGFNGCRKHQKVEDPRFLYWADKLGFLVWGECASAASYSEEAVSRLTKEWLEIIERDYNHPCIVTWVPINESWGVPHIFRDERQRHHSLGLYHLIHSLDMTRLVISNDGWEMTETDICAVHNYNHGKKEETEKYEYYKESLATIDRLIDSVTAGHRIYAEGFEYRGAPVLLTEFGGIGFKADHNDGWGYTSVSCQEEYLGEYERIMRAVFASEALWGYCYTQLTDIEQEINGILTYDRRPKCDLDKIRKINSMWHVDTARTDRAKEKKIESWNESK